MVGLYINIALFFSFEGIFEEGQIVQIKGEIINIKQDVNTKNKYVLKVLENTKNKEDKKLKNKKIIIYTDREINFEPGNILVLDGEIHYPDTKRNFYGFDYRKYLKQKKIYGILYVEKFLVVGKKFDINAIFAMIQNDIVKKCSNIYDKDNCNILSKMLFGIEIVMGDELKNTFKLAGISHILAISGLHISYLIIAIDVVLKKTVNNIKTRNILSIIFLILFMSFTGFSASCVRACIMNILVLISQNLYRKSDFYRNILISFIIINYFNIYNIFNVGMWLSFCGTLGIVLFQKFLFLIFKTSNNKVNYILNIILVSISAQILIFPITVYMFNSISFISFISNVFVSILIGPIIILGYLSVIFCYIFKPVSVIISKVENILLSILKTLANFFGNLPFSQINVIGNSLIPTILYYFCLLIVVLYYKKRKFSILKIIVSLKSFIIKKKLKKNICLKNYRKYLVKIILCIMILFLGIKIFEHNDELKIYFVDVGQGDCTIIKYNEKSIIIDGGEGGINKYDYGKNVLYQHLLKLGIDKIDYMIFSHMDNDHSGGLLYILENMKVKNVIFGSQFEENYNLKKVIEIANKKKVKITVVKKNDRITIDKNLYFDVLWPDNANIIKNNSINNNALVLKLNYICKNDFSVLFTGDIEEEAEKSLINNLKKNNYTNNILNSTILKVAHHGSDSSSIEEFLELVKPKIALIGVGLNNKFGHPKEEILKRLEKINCKIFRTDLDGEISIIVNKNGKIKIKKCISNVMQNKSYSKSSSVELSLALP